MVWKVNCQVWQIMDLFRIKALVKGIEREENMRGPPPGGVGRRRT